MLHPSYTELMSAINEEAIENGENPVISSRYSIVIAASKRARQLIAGDKALVRVKNGRHLSTAVEELYQGKIKILPSEAVAEEVPEEENMMME